MLVCDSFSQVGAVNLVYALQQNSLLTVPRGYSFVDHLRCVVVTCWARADLLALSCDV